MSQWPADSQGRGINGGQLYGILMQRNHTENFHCCDICDVSYKDIESPHNQNKVTRTIKLKWPTQIPKIR